MKAKDRLLSVRRILSVQQQTRRLAEWKLAAAHREASALEQRQSELSAFLDSEEGMSPVFAANAMRQLQAIAAAKDMVEKRREAEEARLLIEAQRVGRAERLVESAATDAAREAEREALADAIERLAGRSCASLP